jgi:hypothetical protein
VGGGWGERRWRRAERESTVLALPSLPRPPCLACHQRRYGIGHGAPFGKTHLPACSHQSLWVARSLNLKCAAFPTRRWLLQIIGCPSASPSTTRSVHRNSVAIRNVYRLSRWHPSVVPYDNPIRKPPSQPIESGISPCHARQPRKG